MALKNSSMVRTPRIILTFISQEAIQVPAILWGSISQSRQRIAFIQQFLDFGQRHRSVKNDRYPVFLVHVVCGEVAGLFQEFRQFLRDYLEVRYFDNLVALEANF